jgi:predicted transcriptional regulator
MGKKQNKIKATRADEVIIEASARLSDMARSLWIGLAKEKEEGGTRAIKSYLRTYFEELAQDVEKKIQIVNQGISKDMGV